MTDQAPKRPRGRPPRYSGEGKRQNFSFRVTPQLRERLIAAVQASGRSLSEEIEFRLDRDLNWEQAGGDIRKELAEARAIRSEASVHAIRAAAISVLLDIEGRPTRAVIELERLLAKSDGVARGMLGTGFVDANAPPPLPTRSMTPEEAQQALEKLDELRRLLLAAAPAAEKKSA